MQLWESCSPTGEICPCTCSVPRAFLPITSQFVERKDASNQHRNVLSTGDGSALQWRSDGLCFVPNETVAEMQKGPLGSFIPWLAQNHSQGTSQNPTEHVHPVGIPDIPEAPGAHRGLHRRAEVPLPLPVLWDRLHFADVKGFQGRCSNVCCHWGSQGTGFGDQMGQCQGHRHTMAALCARRQLCVAPRMEHLGHLDCSAPPLWLSQLEESLEGSAAK